MPRCIHFWSAMLDRLPVAAVTDLPFYSQLHTIGSRTPKHMQRQARSFAERYLMRLVFLQCSESDQPLHISVMCWLCLVADCSLSTFFLILLQMLLSMSYVVQHSPSAVTALTSVHVQCLQAFGEVCSSIAASHWLLSKLLGPHSQWPGDVVGDGLACSCMVMDSHLKPGGEAFLVAGQDNLAVPSFTGPWWYLAASATLPQPTSLILAEIWRCIFTPCQVGSTMLPNLSAPALRHECHSRLASMPSYSRSIY